MIEFHQSRPLMATYSVPCNWRSQWSHSAYALPRVGSALWRPTSELRQPKNSKKAPTVRIPFRTMDKSLREESTKLLMHMQYQMEIKKLFQGELERANMATEN